MSTENTEKKPAAAQHPGIYLEDIVLSVTPAVIGKMGANEDPNVIADRIMKVSNAIYEALY